MNDVAIDPIRFREVLGKYPTGVCAITALSDEGSPIGMVVGTFTSVSLDPPLVGFLPGKTSSSWPMIAATGRFCVNVLGSDQIEVCRQIAGKGPDKFAGLQYSVSMHGLPVLSNPIARIECELHSVSDAGDHWFVLGRVLHLEIGRDEDPMLFYSGRYGGFGALD